MSKVVNDLKYSESHEWVKIEGNIATVGITDHAQALLGELVYVELPEVDTTVSAGDEVCVVESTKAASDVYTPLSGKIVAVNEVLEDAPNQVNDEPYKNGWLFKVAFDQSEELDKLLTADAYQKNLS